KGCVVSAATVFSQTTGHEASLVLKPFRRDRRERSRSLRSRRNDAHKKKPPARLYHLSHGQCGPTANYSIMPRRSVAATAVDHLSHSQRRPQGFALRASESQTPCQSPDTHVAHS